MSTFHACLPTRRYCSTSALSKLYALSFCSVALLLGTAAAPNVDAQSLQAPVASRALGGMPTAASLDGASAPPRQGAVAAKAGSRVMVKFRAPFAALVESELSPDDLSLAPAGATNMQVAAFLSRYLARSIVPVHPAMVRAKLQRRVSAQQLASEVRQRFAVRARRLNATFAPPDLSRTYTVDLTGSATSVQRALRLLRGDPNVEYAEPDGRVSASYTPNDPYLSSYGSWGQAYPDLWGILEINAPLAWDNTCGSGIVVAVVDTGIDYNHPDISANVWTNSREVAGNGVDDDHNGFIDDTHGWNFIDNSNDPLDDNGHGTHVSGTIAAEGNNSIGVIGVAWQAKIMPVKALDSSGSGDESVLAEALVYAADSGADVINNSWGGYGNSQTIADAVAYAHNLGVVIVAAAGNSADDARNYLPANIPDVITVAASDPSGALASFSNFGPKIDIAAPGTDILSLQAAGTLMGTKVADGYTRADGTSMAAPHVSGAAALILAQHPAYSNEQVRQVLRSSANDLGSTGYDLQFGYGGLDVSAAMAVANPLEAKIESIQYGSSPTGPITISGVARGAGFASYTLEYGSGPLPTAWTQFQASSLPADGALGQFDPSVVVSGDYTVRLTAYSTGGAAFSDRMSVVVNMLAITSPVPPNYPNSSTTFKPGKTIPIVGTATGGGFQSFQVAWAPGVNATSGWQTAGITLTGSGQSPVVGSQLAAWDTSGIHQAGYYTLQLSVTSSLANAPVTTSVYFEPDLMSADWPVWLEQGFQQGSGLVPALNADGTWRLLLAGSADLSVSGALWTLNASGSAELSSLAGYAGNHSPVVADIDNNAGEEAALDYDYRVGVYRQDMSSFSFLPTPTADLISPLLTIEDLDGDSLFETMAVGQDFTGQMAYVFAWRPNGELVNNNFPIQIQDKGYSAAFANRVRLLVGDFEGDGQKEIVVQEGLTSSTFTLRRFAANGTPLPWSIPVVTGKPAAMMAADLDYNGKLETVLLSFTPSSQWQLDVFQPDGSERQGWPLQLTARSNLAYLSAANLDRNGQMEIVLSAWSNIYVFHADGTIYSNAWPLSMAGAGFFGAVVIGDIDGDGFPEIVTARADPSAASFDYHLVALRRDGSTARSWQLNGMKGYDMTTNGVAVAYPVPTIGDFNQDGITDVAVAYNATAPGDILPGIVSIVSTGAPYEVAAMDWPLIEHDARGTAVLRASSNSVTTVLSSANPSLLGQPVDFTATVAAAAVGGPPVTGSVNLLEGTTHLGSCVLAFGTCVINTAALDEGTHNFTAKFAGDSHFSPSLAPLAQVVNSLVPGAALEPGNLNFGDQLVETTSAAQVETITNTGSGSLTISAVTMGGTNASDFAKSADTCAGATLGPNGACTVSVTFRPAAAGTRTAFLSISDNAPGAPQILNISGTGTAPAVRLSSPPDFASQLVGSTGGPQTVSITNAGNSDLTISGITVTGPFALAGQGTTCSTSTAVAAAATCAVAVTFTPTAGGPAVGSLSFTDNAPGSPHTVSLTAVGQDFMLAPASGSPSSANVIRGQSANYLLSVGGQGGLSGALTLTCSGVPAETTCLVSPNPATIGSSEGNVTVTVATTTASVNPPFSPPIPPFRPPLRQPRCLLILALLLTAVMAAARRWGGVMLSRGRLALIPMALTLLATLALASCGGGGGGATLPNHTFGTPAGTYTVTVTGTLSSGACAVSHSMTLTLTVGS